MPYPQWLIVAGVVLVVLGCIGLAWAEEPAPKITPAVADIKPTEIAHNNEQGLPGFLTAQTDANQPSLPSRRGTGGPRRADP